MLSTIGLVLRDNQHTTHTTGALTAQQTSNVGNLDTAYFLPVHDHLSKYLTDLPILCRRARLAPHIFSNLYIYGSHSLQTINILMKELHGNDSYHLRAHDVANLDCNILSFIGNLGNNVDYAARKQQLAESTQSNDLATSLTPTAGAGAAAASATAGSTTTKSSGTSTNTTTTNTTSSSSSSSAAASSSSSTTTNSNDSNDTVSLLEQIQTALAYFFSFDTTFFVQEASTLQQLEEEAIRIREKRPIIVKTYTIDGGDVQYPVVNPNGCSWCFSTPQDVIAYIKSPHYIWSHFVRFMYHIMNNNAMNSDSIRLLSQQWLQHLLRVRPHQVYDMMISLLYNIPHFFIGQNAPCYPFISSRLIVECVIQEQRQSLSYDDKHGTGAGASAHDDDDDGSIYSLPIQQIFDDDDVIRSLEFPTISYAALPNCQDDLELINYNDIISQRDINVLYNKSPPSLFDPSCPEFLSTVPSVISDCISHADDASRNKQLRFYIINMGDANIIARNVMSLFSFFKYPQIKPCDIIQREAKERKERRRRRRLGGGGGTTSSPHNTDESKLKSSKRGDKKASSQQRQQHQPQTQLGPGGITITTSSSGNDDDDYYCLNFITQDVASFSSDERKLWNKELALFSANLFLSGTSGIISSSNASSSSSSSSATSSSTGTNSSGSHSSSNNNDTLLQAFIPHLLTREPSMLSNITSSNQNNNQNNTISASIPEDATTPMSSSNHTTTSSSITQHQPFYFQFPTFVLQFIFRYFTSPSAYESAPLFYRIIHSFCSLYWLAPEETLHAFGSSHQIKAKQQVSLPVPRGLLTNDELLLALSSSPVSTSASLPLPADKTSPSSGNGSNKKDRSDKAANTATLTTSTNYASLSSKPLYPHARRLPIAFQTFYPDVDHFAASSSSSSSSSSSASASADVPQPEISLLCYEIEINAILAQHRDYRQYNPIVLIKDESYKIIMSHLYRFKKQRYYPQHTLVVNVILIYFILRAHINYHTGYYQQLIQNWNMKTQQNILEEQTTNISPDQLKKHLELVSQQGKHGKQPFVFTITQQKAMDMFFAAIVDFVLFYCNTPTTTQYLTASVITRIEQYHSIQSSSTTLSTIGNNAKKITKYKHRVHSLHIPIVQTIYPWFPITNNLLMPYIGTFLVHDNVHYHFPNYSFNVAHAHSHAPFRHHTRRLRPDYVNVHTYNSIYGASSFNVDDLFTQYLSISHQTAGHHDDMMALRYKYNANHDYIFALHEMLQFVQTIPTTKGFLSKFHLSTPSRSSLVIAPYLRLYATQYISSFRSFTYRDTSVRLPKSLHFIINLATLLRPIEPLIESAPSNDMLSQKMCVLYHQIKALARSDAGDFSFDPTVFTDAFGHVVQPNGDTKQQGNTSAANTSTTPATTAATNFPYLLFSRLISLPLAQQQDCENANQIMIPEKFLSFNREPLTSYLNQPPFVPVETAFGSKTTQLVTKASNTLPLTHIKHLGQDVPLKSNTTTHHIDTATAPLSSPSRTPTPTLHDITKHVTFASSPMFVQRQQEFIYQLFFQQYINAFPIGEYIHLQQHDVDIISWFVYHIVQQRHVDRLSLQDQYISISHNFTPFAIDLTRLLWSNINAYTLQILSHLFQNNILNFDSRVLNLPFTTASTSLTSPPTTTHTITGGVGSSSTTGGGSLSTGPATGSASGPAAATTTTPAIAAAAAANSFYPPLPPNIPKLATFFPCAYSQEQINLAEQIDEPFPGQIHIGLLTQLRQQANCPAHLLPNIVPTYNHRTAYIDPPHHNVFNMIIAHQFAYDPIVFEPLYVLTLPQLSIDDVPTSMYGHKPSAHILQAIASGDHLHSSQPTRIFGGFSAFHNQRSPVSQRNTTSGLGTTDIYQPKHSKLFHYFLTSQNIPIILETLQFLGKRALIAQYDMNCKHIIYNMLAKQTFPYSDANIALLTWLQTFAQVISTIEYLRSNDTSDVIKPSTALSPLRSTIGSSSNGSTSGGGGNGDFDFSVNSVVVSANIGGSGKDSTIPIKLLQLSSNHQHIETEQLLTTQHLFWNAGQNRNSFFVQIFNSLFIHQRYTRFASILHINQLSSLCSIADILFSNRLPNIAWVKLPPQLFSFSSEDTHQHQLFLHQQQSREIDHDTTSFEHRDHSQYIVKQYLQLFHCDTSYISQQTIYMIHRLLAMGRGFCASCQAQSRYFVHCRYRRQQWLHRQQQAQQQQQQQAQAQQQQAQQQPTADDPTGRKSRITMSGGLAAAAGGVGFEHLQLLNDFLNTSPQQQPSLPVSKNICSCQAIIQTYTYFQAQIEKKVLTDRYNAVKQAVASTSEEISYKPHNSIVQTLYDIMFYYRMYQSNVQNANGRDFIRQIVQREKESMPETTTAMQAVEPASLLQLQTKHLGYIAGTQHCSMLTIYNFPRRALPDNRKVTCLGFNNKYYNIVDALVHHPIDIIRKQFDLSTVYHGQRIICDPNVPVDAPSDPILSQLIDANIVFVPPSLKIKNIAHLSLSQFLLDWYITTKPSNDTITKLSSLLSSFSNPTYGILPDNIIYSSQDGTKGFLFYILNNVHSPSLEDIQVLLPSNGNGYAHPSKPNVVLFPSFFHELLQCVPQYVPSTTIPSSLSSTVFVNHAQQTIFTNIILRRWNADILDYIFHHDIVKQYEETIFGLQDAFQLTLADYMMSCHTLSYASKVVLPFINQYYILPEHFNNVPELIIQ